MHDSDDVSFLKTVSMGENVAYHLQLSLDHTDET